jgi:hypothetical protein
MLERIIKPEITHKPNFITGYIVPKVNELRDIDK